MHSLLAPVLAQLLTASAGARTEARDVVELGVQHLEGSASAGVGLGFSLPFLSLAVGYAPEVTVDPLESTPREVTLSDRVFAGANVGHTFKSRRTSLKLEQSAGYSVENPVIQALSAPPPAQPTLDPLGGPGGADGTGADRNAPPEPKTPNGTEAADARRGQDYRVQTWSLRSLVEFERALSRESTFTTQAGYSLGAGVAGRSRIDNPLVQGPDAGVSVGFDATRRDDLTTSLTGQYRWSETGNHGQIVLLGERWKHDFNRHTRSELGAGISYSREWIDEGAVLNSIYPAGLASIRYTTRVARGMLTFGAGAAAAPVLDVTTATVDPRLGVGGAISWTRQKWTLGASISSSVSFATDPNSPGAFNSLSANATATYDLGAGFKVDFGGRSAWEEFEGVTVVNPESAIFVGLSWGASVPLIEPRTAR